MLFVEVLDLSARRHKLVVQKTARWLMRRFNKSGFSLEIALVGKQTMNKNILAFPPKANFPRPDLRQKPLGEIYLNPRIILQQGWTIPYMVIHGFLHLLGYDHKKKNDRIDMERLEQKLLGELRLTKHDN